MARKSALPAKQRSEAVLALLRKEEPISQLARRYGVSEQTLYRWSENFISAGQEAMEDKKKSNESGQIARLKKDIEERERCIGEITIANTILKKKLDGYY